MQRCAWVDFQTFCLCPHFMKLTVFPHESSSLWDRQLSLFLVPHSSHGAHHLVGHLALTHCFLGIGLWVYAFP